MNLIKDEIDRVSDDLFDLFDNPFNVNL